MNDAPQDEADGHKTLNDFTPEMLDLIWAETDNKIAWRKVATRARQMAAPFRFWGGIITALLVIWAFFRDNVVAGLGAIAKVLGQGS